MAITMQPLSKASVSFIIRYAVPDDTPEIVEIDRQVSGQAKLEYWNKLFATGRCEEPRATLVAERDGHVLGFAIGTIRAWEFGSEPCGWIFAISIKPDNREEGVAASLFDAMCTYFHRAGVKTVRTMIRRDEHLLMAFFRSQGMMAGPFIQLEQSLEDK